MIKVVQLDPNGLCNAKCWFCPVAYGGNPKIGQKNMDFDALKNIPHIFITFETFHSFKD